MRDIVFLHGGDHGGWCWERVIACLAAHPDLFGKAVALDAPGCGLKRGRPTEGLSVADVVAELNADVRAAGVKDAIIVGHSLAGVIVPRMVTADPDLYSQVVMLTTAAPKEGDTIVQLMGSGVHGSSGTAVGFPLDPTTTPRQDQFRPMFCEGMDEADITWLLGECAQDHWPMCVATEPVTRAGFIGLRPVTFIVTLRDGILPVPWQGRFAERFGPDTAIVSIDTPHEPFITHPRLVADTLAAIALGQR